MQNLRRSAENEEEWRVRRFQKKIVGSRLQKCSAIPYFVYSTVIGVMNSVSYKQYAHIALPLCSLSIKCKKCTTKNIGGTTVLWNRSAIRESVEFLSGKEQWNGVVTIFCKYSSIMNTQMRFYGRYIVWGGSEANCH